MATPETLPSNVPTEDRESRAAKMVREVFESGRPLTYIRSAEEQRVARVLAEAGYRLCPSAPVPVWTWSLTEGLDRIGAAPEPGTESPRAALDFIVAHRGPAIFHLKDFHEPLRDSPEIRRRLRDVYASCLDQGKFVVITSPVRFVPEEVERNLLFLDLRPPDLVELVEFLREESGETEQEILEPAARALQGLTLDEARYALRRALALAPRLGPESMPALLEEKRLLVNRSGVIEFDHQHHGSGRRRRTGRPEEVAARAPQAVSDARQRERRNRPQGPAADGHSGLRQEPLRQGHRFAFPASALPHRHDRDLLRAATASPKAPSSRPAA